MVSTCQKNFIEDFLLFRQVATHTAAATRPRYIGVNGSYSQHCWPVRQKHFRVEPGRAVRFWIDARWCASGDAVRGIVSRSAIPIADPQHLRNAEFGLSYFDALLW